MEIQRYGQDIEYDMASVIKRKDGPYVLYADHLAAIKELQDMIAFLIAFVPDMTERGKYLDWLTERRNHD
jgi:hypothetical protein